MVNRFTNSKVKKISKGSLTQSSSKLLVTSADCWNEICAGGEWRDLPRLVQGDILSLYKMDWKM